MTETLSGKEALQQKFEQTDKLLEQYRLSDHEQLKDAEARLGAPLTHAMLIQRVLKLNSNLWAEDSINDSSVVGLYRRDQEGNKEFLVAFDKGWMPEFSIIFTDAADLPVKEKRGWRTVLIRLLKKRALSWAQVKSVFGDVHGTHERNTRWRQETRPYRQ